jgi:hypothetical protein
MLLLISSISLELEEFSLLRPRYLLQRNDRGLAGVLYLQPAFDSDPQPLI